MTTIRLPYEEIVPPIFINGEISGDQMNALTHAFKATGFTRADIDALPTMLVDWKPATLKRCLERARALFTRAEVAASPPPMLSDKDILKALSSAMTISITDRRWTKLLHYPENGNLRICYEGDDGSGLPDRWIPAAYFHDFTHLGGSREAFVAFLEGKGARRGRTPR